MKKSIYMVGLLAVLTTLSAAAQTDFIAPPVWVMNASAQSLFSEYLSLRNQSDIQRTALLDIINSKNLPATQNNTNSLVQSYKSSNSEPEKIAILRLLGQMYDQGDVGVKNTALDAILSATQDVQLSVAGEATRIYSESGYFSNSLAVLNKARDSKIIDRDTYAASLAKLMLIAPQEAVQRIASMLSEGDSRRAIDILSLAFSTDSQYSLAPGSRKIILEMLEKNEPEFPKDKARMGALDAIRYDTWLNASANLAQSVKGEDRNSYVSRKLMAPNIDERKLVAYVVSASQESSSLNVKSVSSTQRIRQLVSARANAYPDDSLTAEAMRRLSE
ncbi:hypothetical protein QRO08_24530 [Paracidovorax citrulli]|uniref:HEAT repeat domain-containing protein n=1 Tax=Paracidovorax citrulli TaxID=80869 RepID=A0ABY9APU4_PARCI|nr:hypothetical protein [Paracidovorax citrulli]UMT85538.1 hypothetical protein FRC75_20420 [Paracidovorax citrulli]WIY29384.1 hypothetical protein QRO09_20410 [Paracidovorax citrulli]WIY38603.1 hypothetical protein QRO10_20605 [Paracidovorax citrulli]WIY44171.1 hypothetical protein QRO12_00370 [Paracidovorax citrulli]WIY48941.1 hypothetical protein QRO08_24530 [Paracidovorax citrulli]